VFRLNQLNHQPNLAKVHVSICWSVYPLVRTEYIAGLATGKTCNSVTAYANSFAIMGDDLDRP